MRVAVFLLCFFVPALVAAKPIVVLAGGYGSCPWVGSPKEMRMSAHLFEALKGALVQGQSVQLLRACSAFDRKKVYVDVQLVERDDHELLLSDRSKHTMARAKLPAFVAALRGQSGGGANLLVGQSYGGWTVMKIALALSHVDVLATIDPISVANCKVRDILWHGVSWSTAAACTSFPLDLVGYVNAIRLRTYSWLHFYQTDFDSLHSGPCPEADLNQRRSYGTSWLPFGAHAFTETDSGIWTTIAAELAAAL